MGLKIRTPLPRTIRLTGFETIDGMVVVFDRLGNRVGVVDAGCAQQASTVGLSRIAWDIEIDRMLARFARQLAKRTYASMPEWERKLVTWLHTQQDPVRVRNHARFFSPSKRSTWEQAIQCMRYQFKNANKKATVNEDKWMQWAETKRRNSERRQSRHGGQDSTAGDDREAGIQMRWHFSGASA
jgi:hypothetical protein